MQKDYIKVKAMCLFHNDGKILASKDFDSVKKQYFYRVLGGHVEFHETCENTVRREIQEEIQSEIENLKFIDILENIFVYEGKKGHEIVFLYAGELTNTNLFSKEFIPIIEENYQGNAEWVTMENILHGDIPLYPLFNYEKVFKELGYL